ncbi:hypothetical protein E4U42_000827 [Claviceps africana]|uniref:Uncharacterized protein n=1 Tax=Claviceps africana TaxID=83212 RepID=A0A8K0J9W9_9HYPO|nr:hypothetical protein E4U42_000827 [Claviceps africana]
MPLKRLRAKRQRAWLGSHPSFHVTSNRNINTVDEQHLKHGFEVLQAQKRCHHYVGGGALMTSARSVTDHVSSRTEKLQDEISIVA